MKPTTEAKRMDNTYRSVITIRAEDVSRNDDGTWNITMVGRDLSEQERETIREMFPYLEEQVYKLLNKEMLLNAMEL